MTAETQQDRDRNPFAGGSEHWAFLAGTPEGRILAFGLTLSFLCALLLALSQLVWPERGESIAGMTAMAILFGRAAGMSFGYAMGLGHGLVIFVASLIETLFVLILYPLFVIAWERITEQRFLQRLLAPIRKAAVTNQDRIQRYGVAGVMLFVTLPFWMTGPVVGSAIGYLIGLRRWVNLTAVIVGTCLAIGIYALILGGLTERVASYGKYAPFLIVAALVLLALGARFLHSIRKSRRQAADAEA